jgi:hypothetical protein
MSDPGELFAVEKTVDDMRAKKALSEASYNQCLVTLASEHLCIHHETEYALILLNKCSPDYFDQTIVQQMKLDHLFAEAVIELVYRLVQLGITLDVVESINVPPAEA